MKRALVCLSLAFVTAAYGSGYRSVSVPSSATQTVAVAGQVETAIPSTPATATMQGSAGRLFVTQKGSLNHYRLRPRILTEQIESAREIQTTVTSNAPIAGQIFRLSTDNLNGISCTLGSAGGEVLDDFESYADSAALQAVWVASDPTELALLATIIVFEGDQSMLVPMDADVDDEWARTITATDYTGFTFSLAWYQSKTYAQAKCSFFIEDSAGNSKFLPMVVEDEDSWENFDFREVAMVEDAGNTLDTDTTDIVKYGVLLFDRSNNTEGYLDALQAVPEPGQIGCELWDMGATLPTAGVTTLADGSQYMELGDKGINGGTITDEVTIDLIGGKRVYDVFRFSAGTALEIPSNTTLNQGNYYAVTFNYIDTDTAVYGPNTTFATNYYQNGYAFTAPDTNTSITALGQYSDLCVQLFAAEDAYINTTIISYLQTDGSLATPGLDASSYINIENRNMRIVEFPVLYSRPQPFVEADFDDTRLYLPKGGKFEVNHSDDFTDNVADVFTFIGYLYTPIETYD